MEHFYVRPLSEADIDTIIKAAGGDRAHQDADRRENPGADYRLGEALIELKALDDEGLKKPERQAKLATLFREQNRTRPVVVLDHEKLTAADQRRYDRILEGPIKTAVNKARKQLKQSKSEHLNARASVLFVINNGYTALDHEAILRMVAQRARNDTEEIDGVVVAGCYYYSDSFDSYFLWPMDYVPINIDHSFSSFDKLHDAWNAFADNFMTSVVMGQTPPSSLKGPVVDTQFELDGVTYVKPAPPMGLPSEFFRNGRPRTDSSGMTRCPPVAITFPDLPLNEWDLFREEFAGQSRIFSFYQEWQDERAVAAATGEPLKPFVPIHVTHDSWKRWCDTESPSRKITSVFEFATAIFESRVRDLIASARERSAHSILPSRYILAVTEEIGQDRANDVSHIVMMREFPNADPVSREIVVDARMFHEYAVAVASAYAIAEGVECVLWQKDLSYAWL